MKSTYKNSILNKKKICIAYLSLLNEKENLTITNIVKIAGINRGTFYLHFANISEVGAYVEELISTNFKALEKSFRQIEIDKTPEIIFTKLNEIISKDIEFYSLLIKSRKAYDIKNKIKSSIIKSISNNFMIMRYVSNYENFKIIVQYIVSGAIDTYIDWFKGNISIPLDDISSVLSKMITGGLKGYINYGY